jgi:hypothetical protein
VERRLACEADAVGTWGGADWWGEAPEPLYDFDEGTGDPKFKRLG